MTAFHPSVSAVGLEFEEQTSDYDQESRAFLAEHSSSLQVQTASPSDRADEAFDAQVEEAMHLDQ